MISEFITQVKTRGLARNNRFRVNMPIPGNTNQIVQVANLFCDSLQLPSSTIGTAPHRIYGELREMPYEKMYEPINMSFYIDSGMEVKKTFEEWMERIFDTRTRQFGFYEEYVTTAQIYVQSVDGAEPYVVTLHEAYPKIIGAIPLDGASKDVAKMNLTLQYKYWTSQTVQSLVSSVISKLPAQPNQPASIGYPSNAPSTADTTPWGKIDTDIMLAQLPADIRNIVISQANLFGSDQGNMLGGYAIGGMDFSRPGVDPQFPTVNISGRDPYATGAPTGYPEGMANSALSYINAFFI